MALELLDGEQTPRILLARKGCSPSLSHRGLVLGSDPSRAFREPTFPQGPPQRQRESNDGSTGPRASTEPQHPPPRGTSSERHVANQPPQDRPRR